MINFANITSDTLLPIYCLFGKERLLLSRALESIRRAALKPDTKAFNQDLLEGHTATPAQILACARTLPMLAARRLVLVRGIDEMNAAALEELLPYIKTPSPETVLVLVGDKIDSRMRFFQALKKRDALFNFEPLREKELAGFVRVETVSRGASINDAAAQLVADSIGSDLSMLVQAVEKLTLFFGTERAIHEDDVASVIASTRIHSVFDLVAAVGQRRLEEALRLLRRMLDNRESPLGILALLTRHFRQLWLLRELVRKGLGKGEIASRIGINPYFVDGLAAQAKYFDDSQLRSAWDEFYMADREIKSSRLDDGLILERMVIAICE